MATGRCITVAAGAEMRIGCDSSCDVVLSFPRSSPFSLCPVPSLCRSVARVSCDAAGALRLVVTTHDLYTFVDGVQLTSVGRCVALRSGAAVAFGLYDRRRTFCFFASGLSFGSLRADPRPAPFSPSLPFSLSEARGPRSPRVVQIFAPPSPAATAQEERQSHSAVLSASHAAERNGMAPPCVISPFVVHIVGSRSIVQPLVAVREAASESGASAAVSLITSGGSALFRSYVSNNGRQMMRQQIREATYNPSLKAAASNVMDELNEAFDGDSGQFYSFTPETRQRLLHSFWRLAEHAEKLLMSTPMTVHCQSPIICCGDLHGSFADLKIIFEKAVPFAHWSLLSTPLLFLGDYVDRGPHDVEVVLFLIAWFVLCPDKIILLRGNHEDEEVNGDIMQYGDGSFCAKCRLFFGDDDGDKFWRRVNDLFVRLSVIAIVDKKIFACHGGIPLLRREFTNDFRRNHKAQSGTVDSLDIYNDSEGGEEKEEDEDNDDDDDTPSEDLLRCLMDGTAMETSCFFFRGLMPDAEDSVSAARQRRLIRELLWNDPAFSQHEDYMSDTEAVSESSRDKFNAFGFRSNLGRGDNDDIIREFSAFAIEEFLQRWGFSLLIRAHQQKSSGAEMVQAGRVLTLFSCCNYSGDTNRAGACLVKDGTIHLISWQRPQNENSLMSGNVVHQWAPGQCSMKSTLLPPPYGMQDSLSTSLKDDSLLENGSDSGESEEVKAMVFG